MMKWLYEEFTNKYGFSDGDTVPAYAEAYRDLFVKLINDLLEGNNLELRAGETGHNPVTTYWWDKEKDEYSDNAPKEFDALIEVLDEMIEDPIIDLIEVVVKVDPNADKKIEIFAHYFKEGRL